MKQIQLTITAKSPLAVGKKKPGSVSEAADYIPGSVIRGAIATVILEQANEQPSEADDFQALFLDENAAIFHNAYPEAKEQTTAGVNQVFVMPATAVSSKAKPGFKPKGNGVFDTLIDRFCAEIYGHPYDPNCPIDGERAEPFGGFYSIIKGKYKTCSVSKRLLTRVGINRRRATSEEEILYSLEVLNEVQNKKPATYQSTLFVEDNLATPLLEFINAHTFRLGGAVSRGLGKVEIEAEEIPVDNTLESRIDQFNQSLNARWQTWNIFKTPEKVFDQNRTYFTINLQSDAILTEDWRRTTVITEAILNKYAGVEDDSLQLHTAYSSYDYLSGWNSAWGRMKDVDLITQKGGLYLFSTTERNAWIAGLKQLEIRGVGERTTEGFGQVLICHPFHQIFRENAV
jgi:CRISPR-associated protein Csx10